MLVSLLNRTLEIKFSTLTDGDLAALEKEIRKTFSDIPILTNTSQLIIQVSLCMPVCVYKCFCMHED